MSNYLIEMKGIVKSFPGVLALDHVDFQLRPGEVHMLLGENGAGKSTLIKVLSGAYTFDEGEIFIKGKKVDILSPLDALNRNLRFIYQELNLVQQMDVARNMFLGLEPTLVPALGIVNKRKLYSLAREYLARYHMDLDPREPVENLSVTQQKMIEIAKALVAKVSVLVLDEPTDVLEDQARQELFDIIRKLKGEHDIGFIYISHRYAEVHQLGDRVTILRDGRRVGTWPIADISLDEIIEKMTGGKTAATPSSDGGDDGRRGAQRARHRPRAEAERHLLRREAGGDRRDDRPHGRRARPSWHGRSRASIAPIPVPCLIDGQEIRSADAADGIRNGIAYMTENRKSEGLILGQSIQSNYALPSIRRLSPLGLVEYRAVGRRNRRPHGRSCRSRPREGTWRRGISRAGTSRRSCWPSGWGPPAGCSWSTSPRGESTSRAGRRSTGSSRSCSPKGSPS